MSANILLVDDRPENLLALKAILEPLGCRLVEAHSGIEALKSLLRDEFALILMDVQMPEMDGFETTRMIKSREKTRHIPIIFVTAISKEEQYVFEGYTSGAVDYIFKPFDPEILRSKVMVFMELWAKSEQIKRQSALLLQSEEREHERRLLERERDLQASHMAELVAAKEIAEHARESAERANAAKSEFIASVSHELRTPLNAILGFSKLLLNPRVGPLNDDQTAYTQDVVSSAEHLLTLINDILDLSKIEAGKMTLDSSTFSLAELLEQSLTIVREKAHAHHLTLRTEIAPEVVSLQPILGDARKLKQVMYNLLSNAVKFTPDSGSVTVIAECAAAKQAGDDPCFMVRVRDTGIGIAPEDQERIFGAFDQVDGSYTRRQQGTGLGLALTRRIVEMHGGKMELQSAPGEGSTFGFILPLHIAPLNEDRVDEAGDSRSNDTSGQNAPKTRTRAKKLKTAKELIGT